MCRMEFGGLPVAAEVSGNRGAHEGSPLSEAVRKYILKLERTCPAQITRGGPIIMVQVENEYGSYGDDRGTSAVRDYLKEAGLAFPFMRRRASYRATRGPRSSVVLGDDPRGNFEALSQDPDAHCGEYYRWFDSWGKGITPVRRRISSTPRLYARLQCLIRIYMVHGGTSCFGPSEQSPRPNQRATTTTRYRRIGTCDAEVLCHPGAFAKHLPEKYSSPGVIASMEIPKITQGARAAPG
jgi:beta-galactosidase